MTLLRVLPLLTLWRAQTSRCAILRLSSGTMHHYSTPPPPPELPPHLDPQIMEAQEEQLQLNRRRRPMAKDAAPEQPEAERSKGTPPPRSQAEVWGVSTADTPRSPRPARTTTLSGAPLPLPKPGGAKNKEPLTQQEHYLAFLERKARREAAAERKRAEEEAARLARKARRRAFKWVTPLRWDKRGQYLGFRWLNPRHVWRYKNSQLMKQIRHRVAVRKRREHLRDAAEKRRKARYQEFLARKRALGKYTAFDRAVCERAEALGLKLEERDMGMILVLFLEQMFTNGKGKAPSIVVDEAAARVRNDERVRNLLFACLQRKRFKWAREYAKQNPAPFDLSKLKPETWPNVAPVAKRKRTT